MYNDNMLLLRSVKTHAFTHMGGGSKHIFEGWHKEFNRDILLKGTQDAFFDAAFSDKDVLEGR